MYVNMFFLLVHTTAKSFDSPLSKNQRLCHANAINLDQFKGQPSEMEILPNHWHLRIGYMIDDYAGM